MDEYDAKGMVPQLGARSQYGLALLELRRQDYELLEANRRTIFALWQDASERAREAESAISTALFRHAQGLSVDLPSAAQVAEAEWLRDLAQDLFKAVGKGFSESLAGNSAAGG